MYKKYFTYIMASRTGTLYIGVTNNLRRRVWEHKKGLIKVFTKKYRCDKLVYFEEYNNISEAITREKQLKKWNRAKKQELIKTENPHWEDFSDEF